MKIVEKLFTALSTSDLPFTDVEKVKEDRAKKLDEGSKVIQIIAAQTTCEIWGTIIQFRNISNYSFVS